MDEFEKGYEQGKADAEREFSVELVHPDMYTDGFGDGYAQALQDFLNDECDDPIVVQAREWYDKKERNAHR